MNINVLLHTKILWLIEVVAIIIQQDYWNYGLLFYLFA